MSCSQTIARVILVIINLVFLLLGLGLLIVGCLTQWGSTIISQHIKPLLSEVSSGATNNVDLNTFFSGVAITLIVLGAVIFVIGFLGCCGAMCKYKILLLVYGILILLIIIGEIVCVALMATMSTQIESTLKTILKDSIKNEYGGTNKTDGLSHAWNYIFYELKCCGVDDYKDVQEATKWNRNYSIYYLQTPLSCCQGITGVFPDYTLPDAKCAYAPTDSTSYWKTGCYDAVVNLVKNNSTIVIGIGVGIVVIEIACMVAAFCLYSAWKKEGVV